MIKYPYNIGSLGYLIRVFHNKRNLNHYKIVIFFGIALIEALQKQNWLEAALFSL